ncbi:MAG: CdaR family protein [Filifactoraceae bacterium]
MMKNIFKNNLKIKILSIAFAFFMWIFVMAEVDPIISRTVEAVPVSNITNQAEIDSLRLVISTESNMVTQVNVRGRSSLVNSYINKGPVVLGTIKNPHLGNNQLDMIVQPKDNIEVSVNPVRKDVVLEEISSLRKAISPRVTGEVAEGYEVESISINPDTTLIEGPDSLVSQVNEVIATVDVTKANKDFKNNVKLNAIDSKGNEVAGVKLQVRYVEAVISVNKNKVVPVELVVIDGDRQLPLSNYYIDPKEIQIQGKESVINQITSIKTQPISIEQLRQIESLIVKLDMPEGIKSNIVSGKLKYTNELTYFMSLNFNRDDIIMTEYTEDDIANIYSFLPENIKVDMIFDKGFEGSVLKDDIRLKIDNERTDLSSQKYYFLVESKVPYLSVNITPITNN